MRRSPVASLLLAALLAAGCATGETPAGAVPPVVDAWLEPACPLPDGEPPLTADVLNRVVAQADLPGWQAADVATSARLGDGRLVWVFGDTFRRPGSEPPMVSNSMLVSSGSCVSQLVTGDAGPLLPDSADGTVLWPMSVVAVPGAAAGPDHRGAQDVLLVFLARTRRHAGGGDGGLDFAFRGTSVAVFTVLEREAPQLQQIVRITPDDDDPHQVNWGAAAAVDGGRLHVYGTRTTGEPSVFGRELYVARVPVDAADQRLAWQYWDGSGWTGWDEAAQPVLGADGGVSQTLSVDLVDGRWLAVSKRDGDLGDFVYTWTAPSPTGPWTPRRALPAPAGFDTGRLTYTPLAHPDVDLASGGLLVSISRNTTDGDLLWSDPDHGRPVFVEIPRP